MDTNKLWRATIRPWTLRPSLLSTTCRLGPALGGVRMWAYETEEDALTDVFRLARALVYKCAISGTAFGGGKAVIIGDSRVQKTEALIRAFARFVDTLGGRYITSEDVGTNSALLPQRF